jgi:hypothetical protein
MGAKLNIASIVQHKKYQAIHSLQKNNFHVFSHFIFNLTGWFHVFAGNKEDLGIKNL